MLFWCVVQFVIYVHSSSVEEEKYPPKIDMTPIPQNYDSLTPSPVLRAVDEMDVAQFGDGQHRGHKWYDLDSTDGQSDLKSAISSDTSLSSSSVSESISSGASSVETKERKRATQAHRVCTPCPHDMLKAHKNLGIKWICAGYQRARRTFKSECMMRYRNCQDGTLFVKLSDHRCKNDTYHGKHWFYVYRV